jgi:uncharacterized membrane protein (DUF485 family)/Zn finger protein HypA/HybF involved in hydrogenase expression
MGNKKTGMSSVIRMMLFFAFVGVIIFCIFLIGTEPMTNRESALLGILITILSILASWIITHMYSESQHKSAIEEVQDQHKNNLRTYALKAAEKVNNLSNELNKLSIYLEQELNFTEYHSADEELQAKEERIESAIHIIKTLKSVNDTSLSDWEGVIGDELDQQREAREEKEEELKEVIDRVESLIEDQRQGFLGSQQHAESLRSEVDHLKQDLRFALLQLSGSPFPRKALRKSSKDEITIKCQACGGELSYRQRASPLSFKSVLCPHCGKKLISRFTEGTGFYLVSREIVPVKYICPKCSTNNEVPLDNFPGCATTMVCAKCGATHRIVRTADGLDVRDITPAQAPPTTKALSEEVIALVKDKLPQQPWPIGIHKSIAKELGIPINVVYRAITALIRRKIFFPQVGGTVYVPKTEVNEESPTKA